MALGLVLSCSGGSNDRGPTGPLTPAPVLTKLTVSLSPTTISVGQTATASVTGTDQFGAAISTGVITWSSWSDDIATVRGSGTTGTVTVTGASPGQTSVIATAGGKQGQQTITVNGSGPSCSGAPQLGCGLSLLAQFALIPAGAFQMGSNAGRPIEQPVHTVTISRAFYLQKTEVTQAQWRAVMGNNPSGHSFCGDTCPVEQVKWDDIQTFIQRLNAVPGFTYRLPTEAEWEYAARAGTTGETYGTLDDIAWYRANSWPSTHAVAGKQANAWGLYDMIGNVSELVNDWFESYPNTAVTDPTGPSTGYSRVHRGGSYSDSTDIARAARRLQADSSIRYSTSGFRLVTTPQSAVASVTVSPATASSAVGATQQFTAVMKDPSGNPLTGRTVTWASSNASVAAVNSSTGLATGVAAGTTTITATSEGKSGSATLTVTAGGPGTPVTGSGTIGAAGGTISLSTGTTVSVPSGALTTSTQVTVVETPAADPNRADDPSRSLTIQIASTGRTDTIPVTVNWQVSGAIPNDKDLVFAVQHNTGGTTFTWPTASPSTTTALRANAEVSWASIVVPSWVGSITSVGQALITLQTPSSCAGQFKLSPAPDRTVSSQADVTIILVHGWQMFMRCRWSQDQSSSANAEAGYLDFSNFDPYETKWKNLVSDIRADAVLGVRANVFIYQYPTTLSPRDNAMELRALIDSDTRISKRSGSILVVGHSMGGLVARYLDDSYGWWLGGIITLGTPHLGTPLAGWAITQFLLPSPGLDNLMPNVVEREIPLPAFAPLHAVKGNFPCSNSLYTSTTLNQLSFFVWKKQCQDAGSLATGVGVSDLIVPHSSAIPTRATTFYSAANNGEALTHWDLTDASRVRTNTISKLREYLPAVAPAGVATISVAPATASIAVGATQQFTATLKDASGNTLTNRVVTWTSGTQGLATVNSSTGVATGVAAGTATITATSEGKSGSAMITVTSVAPAAVASVTVSPATASIAAGATQQFAATLKDASGNTLTSRVITWTSGTQGVATVNSSTGVATGVAAGSATITATSEGKTGTAAITVTVAPQTTATLTANPTSIPTGQSSTLTWSSTNATLCAGTWGPNGTSIALATTSGTVSVSPTATTRYDLACSANATSPVVTASATVTVTALPAAVASVTVSPATASIAVGGTQQFTATLKDASGNTLTNRVVTWTSGTLSVATVNSSTGVASGVAAGSSIITATSEGKTGTSSLTVTGGGVSCSGSTQLGCGFALDQFSLIPTGTFQMGSSGPAASSDEGPIHTVTISRAFYIQKTEVTQKQWRAVMGNNPSYFSTCGDTCPVEQVSWDDIQIFIGLLNAAGGVSYRLPTEAEWEYAARAGTTSDSYGVVDDIAWTSENSGAKTHPAAGKPANAWGLFDMLGNVTEWVYDWYSDYSSASVTDPTGPATGTYRVLHGGNWNFIRPGSRAPNRNWLIPSTRTFQYGFRLVMSQQSAVASVSVTPAAPSIAVGASQQFTATTKDANGNTVTGRTVLWSSGTASVATLNSSTGVATGLAAGTSTITATSEGRTGTATLAVTSTVSNRPAGSILAYKFDSALPYETMLGVVDTARTGVDYLIGRIHSSEGNFQYGSAVAECPNGETYATNFSTIHHGVQLWRIDVPTASATLLGEIGIGPNSVASMTCDANNSLLVAGNFATLGTLYRVNRVSLYTSMINSIEETYLGIAQSPAGVLYATVSAPFTTSAPALLVTINTNNGTYAASGVGQQRQFPRVGRLEFRGNRLLGLSAGNLVEINTTTGVVSTIRQFRIP